MYKIAVKEHFDAAHKIRNHSGKCKNLHGHRWDVEAIFKSNKLNELGMIIDFSLVKKQIKQIMDEFDHKNLIEIKPFDKINPTAENIAMVIYKKLIKKEIPSEISLEEIRIWETPNCWASYSP